MFPDARRVLHVFSGGLVLSEALRAANLVEAVRSPDRGACMVLVDMHGPEQGRFPTWQGDLFDFCSLPLNAGRFDLILADPPYSAEDAEKYDCPPPNRAKIMRSLRPVCKRGGNLVWLDQVWPMHRKDQWKTWGTIGLVRSTNHRVRLVSIFEAQ
jgi:16S rRNA G966 N2-methylase RsmD